jgi:diguanylate cyclase (GGDEF)-like protein
MSRWRKDVPALLLVALALLAIGVVAAIVALVQGDIADVGDDALPLPFAAAALVATIGWYRSRAAAGQRAEEAEQGRAEAEQARTEAERERDAEKERSDADRERFDADTSRERQTRAKLERARLAEREWSRELRGQIARLHRDSGPLGRADDVRELVLEVSMRLAEATKGLLLSREDADGDGKLDLVCHRGFDNDPTESAATREFAKRVLERDQMVREDDTRELRRESRTDADEELENLLAVPIYVQDDFSGVVVLANRDGGFEELDEEVLLALGDHAGAVLENGRLQGEMRRSYLSTVGMLAEAIEVKDPSVRMHSEEVARYVGAVADQLSIGPQRREELVVASLLHDVGKIGISERILLKPGRLTNEERKAIETHPRIGYRLVEQLPLLEAIAPAVLHHHERWDGNGYPEGLRGEAIPLEARVICVADCFSAMTSQRPYGEPMSVPDALVEVERCAGSQFDPRVAELFVAEVRRNPPTLSAADGLPIALDDPHVRELRQPGEPLIGYRSTAATDGLTLLHGHRHLHETAEVAAARASHGGGPFAVVVVELTGLPALNATAGFGAGDEALRVAAQAVQRASARMGGTAGRLSGRRLAVVVPEAELAAGSALARDVESDLDGDAAGAHAAAAAWLEGESGAAVIARARAGLALST